LWWAHTTTARPVLLVPTTMRLASQWVCILPGNSAVRGIRTLCALYFLRTKSHRTSRILEWDRLPIVSRSANHLWEVSLQGGDEPVCDADATVHQRASSFHETAERTHRRTCRLESGELFRMAKQDLESELCIGRIILCPAGVNALRHWISPGRVLSRTVGRSPSPSRSGYEEVGSDNTIGLKWRRMPVTDAPRPDSQSTPKRVRSYHRATFLGDRSRTLRKVFVAMPCPTRNCS
jgi:hypothetical protein